MPQISQISWIFWGRGASRSRGATPWGSKQSGPFRSELLRDRPVLIQRLRRLAKLGLGQNPESRIQESGCRRRAFHPSLKLRRTEWRAFYPNILVRIFFVALRDKGGIIWLMRQDWDPGIFNLVAEGFWGSEWRFAGVAGATPLGLRQLRPFRNALRPAKFPARRDSGNFVALRSLLAAFI